MVMEGEISYRLCYKHILMSILGILNVKYTLIYYMSYFKDDVSLSVLHVLFIYFSLFLLLELWKFNETCTEVS